jgi:predicted ATPase
VEDYLKAQFPGATTFALPTLARAVYRRTEGNPLFLISMLDELKTQQVLVQSKGRWHLQANLHEVISRVPATLQGTLEGQLHDLRPEEQEVLEAASVAGMSFAVPLVSATTGKSLLAAEEICESLARRERFICRDGMEEWPDRTIATRYRFRHALHQEVSYQLIPPLKRADWHQKIGERREHAFSAEVGTVAVELANHFEQSRDYERAARYLQQAGAQAVRRSAYSEAISLATKGLALLRWLPDSPHRTQLELMLHMVLAVSFATTRGTAVPEVEQTCHRALELCRQTDDDLQLFPILAGLFGFSLVSAQFQTARELSERLLRLAEHQSEPVLKLAAHLALGVVLWQVGELASARIHFDQRHSLYTPQDHLKFLQFGHCPTVTSLAFAASVLWYLGYPDQARRAGQEAVALAERLAHPYTRAVTLDFVSQVFRELREVPIVQTQTDGHLALCREQDFREGLARGIIARGWILAQQGQAKEGIIQIREGIAICEATGTQMDRSHHLAVLAEVYALNDQPDEGLAVLNDALQHVEKTGGRYYEAEIYRLKGQLTLQSKIQGPKSKVPSTQHLTPSTQHLTPSTQAEAEAEACFLKAIEIARRQQAKSLELRATVSLARLRQQQGEHHAARTMLSEIYSWFTEGFDTADLQEAKTLLEELSQ